MDQLIFMLSVYVVGFLFSILVFTNLDNHIKQAISPLIGIAFYSFSVGFLYIIGIPVLVESLFYLLITLWVTIYFVKVRLNRKYRSEMPFLDIKRNIFSKYALGMFLVYLLLGVLFVFLGSPNISPDATQYEGLGRFLAQGGNVSNFVPELPFLINGRFLTIGAMHGLNRLFGSYNLYALYPLMTVWFLGLIGLIFYNMNKELSLKSRIFLVTGLILTLGLYKNYAYHGVRIGSNGLAMIYFSFSIYTLYIYSKTKNYTWLYLGAFLIGTATLIRIDMLIFSLVYFSIQTKTISEDYTLIRNSWLIFLIIALPWRIFTIHLIPTQTWYINSTQVLFLLSINLIMGIFIIMLSKLKYSTEWVYKAAFAFIFAVMIYFAIFDFGKIQLGWELFVKSILFSENWIVYLIGTSVAIMVTPIVAQLDKQYSIFSLTLMYYFVILFLIVGFSGYEKEDHSAVRMLVHVAPLMILSLFIAISNLLKYENILSNYSNLKR